MVNVGGIIKRYWSQVAFGGLVLVIAWPAYRDWSTKHAAEVAEREKKEVLQRVGTDASLTGSLLWSAYQGCSGIGIPNLSECAKYEGTLLQEKAAPAMAQMAMDSKASYDTSCRKLYAQQYCDQLLNRAFHLSQTRLESKD